MPSPLTLQHTAPALVPLFDERVQHRRLAQALS